MVRFTLVALAAVPMCHPSVIRCRKLMRHDEGNTLRSQDHREELRALPRNRVECALFYQLLLVGLVWLCLMLHVVWPSDRATAGRTTPRPAKAPRKRSHDLKPFPGLTRKPPCAACAQAHAHGPQPPGCPPPRLVPTRGRPRQVDTSSHFCPHANCDYRGWVGLGNIS